MGITVDNGVEPSRCLLHATRGLLDLDVVFAQWPEAYELKGLAEIKLAKFFQVTCKSDDESGHFVVYIQIGIHQYIIQQEICFRTKFIDRKNMNWRSIEMRLVYLRLQSPFLTY